MRKKIKKTIVWCVVITFIVGSVIFLSLRSNESGEFMEKRANKVWSGSTQEFSALSEEKKAELYYKAQEKRFGKQGLAATLAKRDKERGAAREEIDTRWVKDNPEEAEYLGRVTKLFQSTFDHIQKSELTRDETTVLRKTGGSLPETPIYRKAYLEGIAALIEKPETKAALLEFFLAPEQVLEEKCRKTPFGNLAEVRRKMISEIDTFLSLSGKSVVNAMDISNKLIILQNVLQESDFAVDGGDIPGDISEKIEAIARGSSQSQIFMAILYLHAPNNHSATE